MSGTSTITKRLSFRVENEVEAIIKRKASEIGVTPSKLLREVLVREFKGTKTVTDRRQLKLI